MYEFKKNGGVVFCSRSCSDKGRRKRLKSGTPTDPIFEGDTVLIPLSLGQWAKVSRESWDAIPELRDKCWSARWSKGTRSYYAHRHYKNTSINMSRVIVNAKSGEVVNHKNFDTLDNTLANLEICTTRQNNTYRRKHIKKTSKYIGVCFHKRQRKWVAAIKYKDKRIHIGSFGNEEDAAKAYNEKAKELFGEHSTPFNEFIQNPRLR
jgi:hypothetical protein